MRAKYGTRRDGRRGNAYVEFALCFMLFITMIVAMFEFSWMLFVKATFHNAVREGVRTAITGEVITGYETDHDGYIKSVIKRNTFGLLTDDEINSHVQIDYFDDNGNPATAGNAGNIIQISIQCYDVLPITSLIRPRDANGDLQPITISVASSDKMEPFPGAAPPRPTPATATACAAS